MTPRIYSVFLLILSISLQLTAQNKKDLSLQDIWASSALRPAAIHGIRSMKDGEHYTTISTGKDGVTRIEKFSYATAKKIGDVLVSTEIQYPGGKFPEFDEYTFSSDEQKLLIPTDFEPLYRRSGMSAHFVVDLKTKTAVPVSEGKQLLAQFSPDGQKVAFVRDNNLFIKDLQNNAEIAITRDGERNKIINGAPDWVYEEEFSFAQAFYWSPDSKKLAWLRFDESEVPEYSMPMYGTLYPENTVFKYPKAGENNSLVNVFVYHLQDSKTVKLNTGDDKNLYFPRVKWTRNDKVCVTRLNRHQNHMELLLADPLSGAISTLYEEKSDTYVDLPDALDFLPDGKHFIISSEKGGFNRLWLYTMEGKRLNAITTDNSELRAYYGYNEKTGLVYYQSAAPTPMERTVYSVKLNGKSPRAFLNVKGHQVPEFSRNFRYCILRHSSAAEPPVYAIYDERGTKLVTLEDNKALIDKLSAYRISPKEFFSFTNEGGVSLNGWMIKPPDFSATKQYPVFMTVYGGPGSGTVENAWEGNNFLWYQLLAQKGYIVVSVDNRGTGKRGEAFKKATYMQLGKLETEDQISAAKYLASLPYVDGTRIGIQGWSYGGYMSSLCITKGADVFKMAIAVAPVTNWRFYDSIYTERFMKTPEENASGYDDNSPINHVARLRGKYLLIHGTADDNVHFQNSVEMVTALVKANKQFDLFFYPDKNHGIYGGNTRLHLYTLMTNYILENL